MKRAIAAMLACLMLAGCADDNIITTENSGSTSRTTTEATSTTTPTTTSASTATTTPTPTATTTTATASATTADTTAAEPEEQEPSGNESITYETVSDGHIFVDFSYIEDYNGTTDISECGEWYDMAVEAVMQTDTYREQNTVLKGIATSDIEFRYEVDIDIKDYLDENGNIVPLLGQAFIEDYDNNGTDECFMRLIIPFRANEKELWELHSFLVYCTDSCEVVTESQGYSFSLLDYGLCKQLVTEEYSHEYNILAGYYLNIYGVVQGKAEKLFYFFRGETVKKDCFLEFHVYQQPFDVLVYYDTVKEQYQYVSSANVSYDDAVSSMLSPAEAAVVHNAL